MYPEHEKLHALMDKVELCGEFLNWLEERGWHSSSFTATSHRELITEFFQIDRFALEKEKQTMLREIKGKGDVLDDL